MASRVFSDEELAQLRGFGEIGSDELVRFFTLTSADRAFVDPGRGRNARDRLGLAVQVCTLPWLGFVPDDVTTAPPVAVARLAEQLRLSPEELRSYGEREQTRTDHLRLAAEYLGWRSAGGVNAVRPPWSLSVMWALSPYTPENGSTLLVPGSHKWEDGRMPQQDEIVSLSFDPGSALVWLGGVYHGGGANTSTEARTGISIIYFQPWLRQVENMVLVVPPDRAAQYSETVQRLLGYNVVQPTFFGHVDGRDPIKLITEVTV